MLNIFQKTIQFIFLAFFVILLFIGKVQLWALLILFGIAASLLLGRIYCGWICPVNTVMKIVTTIKTKLKIKSIKIPSLLENNWIRYSILVLFLSTFAFSMITGKKVPVLPLIFGAGIILTFFFPERLWHRYLCPYGTIMSFPAKISKFSMSIDSSICSNCGVCARTCPSSAISKNNSNHKIIKNECLVCRDCSLKCKKSAIKYKI